ncbi:MAG: hypothetical protein ACON4T_09545 [Synechococcus sp.]
MAGKSGFSDPELNEIKRLYLDEGRSYAQIAKILGRGSETSVRNALVKAKIRRSTATGQTLETFKPGQSFGRVTLVKRLVKSKKLRYHVVCDCGYEFDVDPYRLTLSEGHQQKVSACPRCIAGH